MEKGKPRADTTQQYMSASAAPSLAGFNLYDLLTRVTPGLFILAIMAVTMMEWDFLVSATDSSFFGIIAIFAGFLTGEIIDSVRMSLFAAPKPFRRLLYEERKTGDRGTDLRDRVRNHRFLVRQPVRRFLSVQDEFWPMFKRQFEVDDDLKDSNEIYLRLAADLDPELTALTRRYQTTTMFVQNMRLATPFAIVVTVYSFTVETGASDDLRGLFLFLLVNLWVYLFLFRAIEDTYVRLLLLQSDITWPKRVESDVEQKNLDEF